MKDHKNNPAPRYSVLSDKHREACQEMIREGILCGRTQGIILEEVGEKFHIRRGVALKEYDKVKLELQEKTPELLSDKQDNLVISIMRWEMLYKMAMREGKRVEASKYQKEKEILMGLRGKGAVTAIQLNLSGATGPGSSVGQLDVANSIAHHFPSADLPKSVTEATDGHGEILPLVSEEVAQELVNRKP